MPGGGFKARIKRRPASAALFTARLRQTAVDATTAELLKKQEELEKKARELERRERELESHSLGPGACKSVQMDSRGLVTCFNTDFTQYVIKAA